MQSRGKDKSGIPFMHWEPMSEEQRKKFKRGLAAQRSLKERAPGPAPRIAIHDDAQWRGPRAFDRGLKCNVRGRTHRRDLFKSRGWEEVGDAKLKDFGVD
jgi:hypothetical protein